MDSISWVVQVVSFKLSNGPSKFCHAKILDFLAVGKNRHFRHCKGNSSLRLRYMQYLSSHKIIEKSAIPKRKLPKKRSFHRYVKIPKIPKTHNGEELSRRSDRLLNPSITENHNPSEFRWSLNNSQKKTRKYNTLLILSFQ